MTAICKADTDGSCEQIFNLGTGFYGELVDGWSTGGGTNGTLPAGGRSQVGVLWAAAQICDSPGERVKGDSGKGRQKRA